MIWKLSRHPPFCWGLLCSPSFTKSSWSGCCRSSSRTSLPRRTSLRCQAELARALGSSLTSTSASTAAHAGSSCQEARLQMPRMLSTMSTTGQMCPGTDFQQYEIIAHDVYYGPDVPYYYKGEPDNGKEPREIVPNHENWAKCPCCGYRFRVDTAARSGEWPMHQRCGQRLKIVSG